MLNVISPKPPMRASQICIIFATGTPLKASCHPLIEHLLLLRVGGRQPLIPSATCFMGLWRMHWPAHPDGASSAHKRAMGPCNPAAKREVLKGHAGPVL